MTKDERDMLCRIDERTLRLEKWAESHTVSHNRAGLALLGSLVAVIVALLGVIF